MRQSPHPDLKRLVLLPGRIDGATEVRIAHPSPAMRVRRPNHLPQPVGQLVSASTQGPVILLKKGVRATAPWLLVTSCVLALVVNGALFLLSHWPGHGLVAMSIAPP